MFVSVLAEGSGVFVAKRVILFAIHKVFGM